MEVRATPAVRHDQISLWMPKERLLTGPNLLPEPVSWPQHLLQGPAPDFTAWQATLENLLELRLALLAPVRGRTINGAEAVSDHLQNLIAAIEAISTQIAQGLSEGVTVSELGHLVRLPPELADDPSLAPIAETLNWIVQAQCQQSIGWFDGNPTTLARLSPRDEARRMIRLAGGAEAVLQEAETTDTPQWGLELCDRLILAGEQVEDARSLKSACLHILAEAERDPLRANYYLACAREIDV